jgi:hypothetical protein
MSYSYTSIFHSLLIPFAGPVDGVDSFLQRTYDTFNSWYNDCTMMFNENELVTRFATGKIYFQ